MTQVTEQAITAAARAMFAKGRGGNDDPPDFDSAPQEMKDWIIGIAEAALAAALPHLLPASSQSDEEAASTLLFGRPNIGVDPESVFSVRYKLLVSFLAEFRAAVRAEATLAERERCAKVAQTHSHVGGEDYDLGYLDGRADAATLIRATS